MLENLQLETERKQVRTARTSKDKDKKIPWRGSDPKPKDTWRNNVLDNDDIVDSVKKRWAKKLCVISFILESASGTLIAKEMFTIVLFPLFLIICCSY